MTDQCFLKALPRRYCLLVQNIAIPFFFFNFDIACTSTIRTILVGKGWDISLPYFASFLMHLQVIGNLHS